MVVLLGDFNAKVGRDVSSWKGIIGSHSLYDHTCTNGERLLDLCIGGTLFPHKDIYKYTWTAPSSPMLLLPIGSYYSSRSCHMELWSCEGLFLYLN